MAIKAVDATSFFVANETNNTNGTLKMQVVDGRVQGFYLTVPENVLVTKTGMDNLKAALTELIAAATTNGFTW